MAKRQLPCPTLLRLLVTYDPETGLFTWNARPAWMFPDGVKSATHNANAWNAKYAGRPAFTAKRQGYAAGAIYDRTVSAHRAAWAILLGKWPTDFIDHINGDRGDNRAANLREVDEIENARNKGMTTRNRSGRIGVHFDKRDRRWVAQISKANRTIHIGTFEHLEDAIAARERAERAMAFHENHGTRR